MMDIRKAIEETNKVVINELNPNDTVLVRVESEAGTEVLEFLRGDAEQIKSLMLAAENTSEYPFEVNDIIDRGKPIPLFGSVNTMGDGWGWYDSETNENKKGKKK